MCLSNRGYSNMDFKTLLKRIKTQPLSAEEKEAFESWYAASERHREFYANVKEEVLRESENVDVNKAWGELREKMDSQPKKGLHRYYYIAAASLVIFLLSNFFFHDQKKSAPTDFAPVVTEAGTDKAILQLSDGALIDLGKNASYHNEDVKTTGEELVYDKGDKASKEEVRYNELTVPKGGQYKVTLADGTRVWLNSDTKLKYPVKFRDDRVREVELLYGEAYFEVTSSADNHDNNFWVFSKNQRIEVLGTKFNISNYRGDEDIKTTLVEGKVFLSLKDGERGIILEPGFQAHYVKELDDWRTQKVNTDFVVAWKDGYFKFRDTPLEDIMKTIARWYDVEVRFDNDTLKTARFNGVFRKDQKMEDILDIMKENTSINYIVKGQELFIF